MKKLWLIVTVAVVLLLAACSQERTDVMNHVERNGEMFTIDFGQQQIIHNKDIYQYKITEKEITVTYPNGATYYRSYSGAIFTQGHSKDYDSEQYLPGDTLIALIQDFVSQPTNAKSINWFLIVLGIVVCSFGIWCIVNPNAAWFLHRGWLFRNTEPSEMGLSATVISGVLSVVVGIVAIIIGFIGT